MSYADALANAARKSMETALKTQEASDWNAIMKSAVARGIGSSPLAAYEQRKIAEAYAPQYLAAAAEAQKLGAQIGWEEEKLARELAQRRAELAAQREMQEKQLEMENAWRWRQLDWAKEQFAKELGLKQQELGWEQQKFGKQLSWDQEQFARQLALERQKLDLQKETALWDKALKEAAITGYYKGWPTWEREYQTNLLGLNYLQTLGESRSNLSKDIADSIIADMRAGYWRFRDNPSAYNYQWHIDVAKNLGLWDQLTNADKARVQEEANRLGKGTSTTTSKSNPWQ